MLLAPVKLVIQLISFLPEALRPGVFLALVVLLAWFVFVQRGLPSLWHAICRGAARIVDLLVGVLVLLEYALTTARQRRGESPGNATMVVSNVAERVLDGAGGLYERHTREAIKWKRPPWIVCGVVIAVCGVAWLVMDLTDNGSPVKQELSSVYDHWRDVEAWADVPADRRADPAIAWAPLPEVMRIHHRGRMVGVTLACRTADRCRGHLILRTATGTRLRARLVDVRGRSVGTVHVRLSHSDAHDHHLRARIARVEAG